MAKIQMFFKAVYAGFMIGAGCIVYLSVENKLAGSLLFSFGLLTMLHRNFICIQVKSGL